MKGVFDKYKFYITKRGKIVDVNTKAFELADDAFLLFKSLYNTHYGSIIEDGNLIAIHTGGWSDNEDLIRDFEKTGWWYKNHKITAVGGHYFFNTDINSNKEWEVISILR